MGLAGATASPAVAVGGFVHGAAANLTLAPQEFHRVAVPCPAGSVAVSAIFEPQRTGFELKEFGPTTINGASGWMAAVRNRSDENQLFFLVARCRPAPDGYTVVRQDTTVPAHGFTRAMALCPAGTVVLSGGAMVVGSGAGDFRTQLQESGPATRSGQPGWLTSVRNGDAVAHTVGQFAVCSSPLPGYRWRTTTDTDSTHLGGLADCGDGMKAISGGLLMLGSGQTDAHVTMSSTYAETGHEWAASAWVDDGVRRSASVTAICVNP